MSELGPKVCRNNLCSTQGGKGLEVLYVVVEKTQSGKGSVLSGTTGDFIRRRKPKMYLKDFAKRHRV